MYQGVGNLVVYVTRVLVTYWGFVTRSLAGDAMSLDGTIRGFRGVQYNNQIDIFRRADAKSAKLIDNNSNVLCN